MEKKGWSGFGGECLILSDQDPSPSTEPDGAQDLDVEFPDFHRKSQNIIGNSHFHSYTSPTQAGGTATTTGKSSFRERIWKAECKSIVFPRTRTHGHKTPLLIVI